MAGQANGESRRRVKAARASARSAADAADRGRHNAAVAEAERRAFAARPAGEKGSDSTRGDEPADVPAEG